MTKPLFQIVRTSPLYCGITSGIIGSTRTLLPMTYHTEGCAHAIAGRLAQEDYDSHGDDGFNVVRVGDPLWKPIWPVFLENDGSFDDCPF